MPIIGLTDHAPSFPRIGELRKGAEKVGNKPGADLNGRFRFTSKIDGMEDIFAGEFGDSPNNILCYLPYKTTDENFVAWVEEWGAGSLKWRGDGETAVLWQRPDGTYSTEPKPQPKGGKANGKLHIVIPALKRMGYVVALTTALNDIMELTGNLRAYETLRGDLRGIPFILSRVPRMISTPSGKDGKRARREKWLLHLETVPDYTAAQLDYAAHAALPAITTTAPALTSGHDEFIDLETGEIVEEENPLDYQERANDEEWFADQASMEATPARDDRADNPPRDAVAIATALIYGTEGLKTGPPTEAMLAKVQKDLRTTVGGKGADATKFLYTVFNVDSSKNLTYGQVKVLLDWIDSNKANEYTISPTAIAEAKIVLANE